MLKKIVLLVVSSPFLYFGLITAVSERGEVVVLESQNSQGEMQSTRLWVVDYDGSMWLRSGSAESGWYKRLTQNIATGNPIYLTRQGEKFSPAVSFEHVQASVVNALMQEKYGLSDDAIAILMGEYGASDTLVVRLTL
jgi:hypothetical protein